MENRDIHLSPNNFITQLIIEVGNEAQLGTCEFGEGLQDSVALCNSVWFGFYIVKHK